LIGGEMFCSPARSYVPHWIISRVLVFVVVGGDPLKRARRDGTVKPHGLKLHWLAADRPEADCAATP